MIHGGTAGMYLRAFESDLKLANLSPVSIRARRDAVRRLASALAPTSILAATPDDLIRWQRSLGLLAPATVDSYVRHVQRFYAWALMRGYISADPSTDLIHPRVARGRPHPTTLEDLRTIFACTLGGLRLAYVLGAFAGLRCAEIAGIQTHEVTLDDGRPRVLVHGKGRKDRIVPLLAPVVDEMLAYGLPRAGYVVRRPNGYPYTPDSLSGASYRHLRSLGLDTTLHSCRHAFATYAVRGSGDLLMVAEVLGHANVSTTQIYAEPDMDAVMGKLQPVADMAAAMLCGPRRQLHAVR